MYIFLHLAKCTKLSSQNKSNQIILFVMLFPAAPPKYITFLAACQDPMHCGQPMPQSICAYLPVCAYVCFCWKLNVERLLPTGYQKYFTSLRLSDSSTSESSRAFVSDLLRFFTALSVSLNTFCGTQSPSTAVGVVEYETPLNLRNLCLYFK